jgi:lysophospholipase L1-like esterase
MSLAIKLALSPLLIAQAVHTRLRMPRLPEAAGPRSGVAGAGKPGPRLLIVGDSSAAGVGVDTQDRALAGQLGSALASRLDRAVPWQLCALSGINSLRAVDLLADAHPVDVAVVVTGVNDVVDRLSPAVAMAARGQLVRVLRERIGVRHVVMTPVPPMHRFAGLPQPLRWVAGQDALAHERALQAWAAAQADLSHLPFDLPMDDASLLAQDGFHPGAPLYRLWGAALADHIATITASWPRFHP